jgi:hypothetical protein
MGLCWSGCHLNNRIEDKPPVSLQTPSPISGSPDPFRIPWESFVQLVLEITVKAYQLMCQDGVVQQSWEEDTFSLILATRYIRPLARQHPLNLIVMTQTEVYKPEMYTGAVSTRKAPKIDIRLFNAMEDYEHIYFAWECKRIGDKRSNAEYAALIPKYITEGILRFVDGAYCAGLDDAGMLGYVLAGDVTNIVHDINVSMQHPRRKRSLEDSDHLVMAPAIGAFTDVYRSCHKRAITRTSIRLNHLFLTFDFRQ